MGEIKKKVSSATDKLANKYTNGKFNKTLNKITSGVQDVHDIAGKAVLLSLSKAWIGIGLVKPARTDPTDKLFNVPDWLKKKETQPFERIESESPLIDRYDYDRLYSMQLGNYFMPLSQTFTLRAKKRLNVSSLVDGIDIIQQTRKESKTIDVKIRIGLREGIQDNLQIVDFDGEIQRLSWFLNEMYEGDTVFIINNDMINNTFGVTHVFMTEYKFIPKERMGTFDFEFSLMEVIYGENVLTFDLREVNSDTSDSENSGQIGG